MSAKFLPAVLACMLAALSPARGGIEFEYGPRPPLFVFDPAGFFKPELVKEISDPLAAIYTKEGIDVIVVVLTDIGKAPPEHVAGRFAGAWCESPLHCVVLHVPGREDSPWIVPAGKLIGHLNPEQVQQAVADARRRASAEPKEADKVKAAATEAADMLRYWMANAVNHSELIQSESTRMRAELASKSRKLKITAMIAAAATIPIIMGISFLIVLLRKRGPARFPDHTCQVRLGAPHAGGNHAVADLGPNHS
jgi:hypothetical protein